MDRTGWNSAYLQEYIAVGNVGILARRTWQVHNRIHHPNWLMLITGMV
ncbi:hypothetical protein [Clostridium thailandense]